MESSALIFLACCVALLSNVNASDLNDQDRIIYINTVLQEFVSVCADTGADADTIQKIALKNSWYPRPVDITGASSPPNYAWDAEVPVITFGSGETKDTYSYILGVANSKKHNECFVLLPAVGYEVVREAILHQGFTLNWELDSGRGPIDYHEADFAIGKLLQYPEHSGVNLLYMENPKRQTSNGAKITYCYNEDGSDRGCSRYLNFGHAHGPEFPDTIIEKWFDPKAVTEPPVLDDAK